MKINRTTYRATEILKLLATVPDGLTTSEIGERLELPKTSTFDIVQTLKAARFLKESNNKYTIGFMAQEVGAAYSGRKELYSVAKPHVIKVAEQLKMAGSLVTYDNNGLNYIFEHTPDGAILTPASISGKDFLHASASGKVLFAYMTEARFKKAIAKLRFTPFTGQTILTLDAFRKEIELTKTRGYGLDKREWHELVTCISVPIFNNQRVVAALTVSGLQIDDTAIPGIAQILQKVSDEIAITFD